MMAEKKSVCVDPYHCLLAARYVTFFMTFVMLFIIPLSPLLVGCQSSHASVGLVRPDTVTYGTHSPSSTIIKTLEDASIGGTAGIVIGRQMDALAQELSTELKGVEVERIAEGILITFDSRLLFKHDCVDIQSSARSNFKDLSRKLLARQLTNVMVEGHTDNIAEESYNYFLSEKRASSVEKYLVSQGVNNARIRARGYGEKQPLVSNDTQQGREANRRIELALYANEEMTTLALNGRLGDLMAAKK